MNELSDFVSAVTLTMQIPTFHICWMMQTNTHIHLFLQHWNCLSMPIPLRTSLFDILHSPQLNSQNDLMNNTVIYICFSQRTESWNTQVSSWVNVIFLKKAFFLWNNSILFLTFFFYSGDFTHAKNIALLRMWKLSSHSKEKKASLLFF